MRPIADCHPRAGRPRRPVLSLVPGPVLRLVLSLVRSPVLRLVLSLVPSPVLRLVLSLVPSLVLSLASSRVLGLALGLSLALALPAVPAAAESTGGPGGRAAKLRCALPRAAWNEEILAAREAALRECRENAVVLSRERAAAVSTAAQARFWELKKHHDQLLRDTR